jgi:putative sugar O-methyltransferase
LFARVLLSNLRPTSALEPEWRGRYESAARGQSAGPPEFSPSRPWAAVSRFYRLALRGLGFADFKSVQGRFLAAYEPAHPRWFEALHHVYFEALEKRDAWGLLRELEEPELGGGDVVVRRGRRLSLDLLQSIDELYRMQEALGFARGDAFVFCEVGAGYGRLADVILSAMPRASCWLFDLPESLTLAEYYLTRLHPRDAAVLYPESSDVLASAAELKKRRLVFGLPHQLKSLPPGVVDAFVNVYSFMEMSRPQIGAYFDEIERLDPGALFLKQHKREANLLDGAVNAADGYPTRPGWKPLYKGTSALYDDVFEAVYRIRG